MASSGAMADFARLPTSRKVLLFVVIALLGGFLYHRFVYKSLKEGVAKAKNQQQQAIQQNAQLEADIPRFNELRAKKEVLDRLIVEHQKALPTEAEVPAFFETLERKITEAGVEVLKWNKKNEEPVEVFVKVPLDVELTGNFMQIKRFFASLVEKKQKGADAKGGVEERERIVSIENLALTSPIIRNREIVLTARFTAVTFRQADRPPPVPGAPNPSLPTPVQGGGPAPAMPSTNTAPPLPSSGTPGGAKARVEDSLDKIDQKTKDATKEDSGSARLKGGL
jgi:type IV pilus assembly protein PilO